ncbi:BTB/POZ domain-containing protein 8-like [Argopecten irradians]|uniref:BTB/POZ domain-containing protein 8-like n=1 Tax=Argopecten irradians TaxID=31199 RepID=UPI003711752C
MARPKDKRPLIENERFLSRCAKEEERLRLSLSTGLKKDIDRLFETGLHSDITLKSGFHEIKLHKFILKTRSLEIFNRLHEVCTEAGGDILVLPEWVKVTALKNALRHLYNTLTIQPLLNEDSDTDVGIVQDVIGLLTFHEPPQPTQDSENTEEYQANSDSVDKLSDQIDCDKNNDENASNIDNPEGICDGNESDQTPCSKSIHTESTSPSVNDDAATAAACSSIEKSDQLSESEKEKIEPDIHTNGDKNIDSSEIDIDENKLAENRVYPDLQQELEAKNSSKEDDSSLQDLIKMTYDLSIPYKACDSLGECLLRGYLKELDHDCIISISGAHFKAHKCVLSARCDYFAAMLGGSWMESDAQEICLEGMSPPVMEQVLLYLYGGVLDLEACCPIGEIVMVADMYGLHGLNSIVTYNLKKTYCHFFHKPCSGCETGVIETLTSALTFNLCELRDKCIEWINTNMIKVWRTKAFASLPPEVLDLVCDSAIQRLSIQCVMEVMLDCQKLNRNIPRLKWCEPVLSAVTRLMDSCIEYTAKKFICLLNSGKLRDIDTTLAYQMGLLEEIFGTVIRSLPVSGACQVFERLHALNKASTSEEMEHVWSEEFCAFIRSLYKMCEDFMKLHIHQMALTKDWDLLNKELQTHLMENSSFVVLDMSVKEKKMGPRFARMQKKKTEVQEQKTTLKARPILTSDQNRILSGQSKLRGKSPEGKTDIKLAGKSSLQSQSKGGSKVSQSKPGKSTVVTTSRSLRSVQRGGRPSHPTCSDGKHCESSSKGNESEDTNIESPTQSGVTGNNDLDRVCLPGQSFFGVSGEDQETYYSNMSAAEAHMSDQTTEEQNLNLNAQTSLNAEGHCSAILPNDEGQKSATSLDDETQRSLTSPYMEGEGSVISLNAGGQGSAMSLNAEGQCEEEYDGEILNSVPHNIQITAVLPDPIVFNVELIPILNVSFYENAS